MTAQQPVLSAAKDLEHPAVVRLRIARGLVVVRVRAGLTQRQVAEATDQSFSAIRHLEHARHAVRVDQLAALAAALSVSCCRLLVEMGVLDAACHDPDHGVHRPAPAPDMTNAPAIAARITGMYVATARLRLPRRALRLSLLDFDT